MFMPGENQALEEEVVQLRQRVAELEQTSQTQRLMEAAVLFSTESVLITDANLEPPGPSIVFVNPAFTVLTGYTPEEIIGQSPRILQGPQTSRDVLHELAQTLQKGQPFAAETTNYRKDGTAYVVEWHISPILDEMGDITHWVSLQRDMSERKQAEEERAALYQQVVAAQQALLRELSTPLLPLADRLLAMPLVGSIDTVRVQQVMDVLLEGVAHYRAETVLLDITGVHMVDMQVARALMDIACAVRLLGAEVVVTGISPAMAQTLVQLAVDFDEMVMHSSLQTGLAYALHKQQSQRHIPHTPHRYE
ncbi:MAG: PAS domain S-box protein [Blastochloris sp.]|nr:PAS domain S-box protein [Blastochloris sp.]